MTFFVRVRRQERSRQLPTAIIHRSTDAFRKCSRTLDVVQMARGEKKKSVDIINGSSKGLWPSD